MGSQGDAGQFRTPRHIIDFILDIIEPNKTDTILDPACGTAGFLISAFKYIIKSNLKPQEKQALTENIVGYDIAPVMAEISAVNLYLHGFKNPKIFEYDTLTSTDKWQDKFDIILANPPFMTPKGGIKPHNLFELKANRAEVLFSEYIMEHLKSTGRAGFIVPEGIIFKSENAYKTLRKNFITQGLYCVVSLPSGVFQPYSGVKTSIIFIDKKLKGHNKDILFINIKNDGFDLGAQRKPIKDNNLPQATEIVKEFKSCISSSGLEEFKNKYKNNKLISVVNVEEIEKGGDYNLSANRYIKDEVLDCEWEIVELKNLCKIQTGKKDANYQNKNGKYTFFTCAMETTKSLEYSFDCEAILIVGNGANVGTIFYYNGKFEAYQRTYILNNFKKTISVKFIFFYLKKFWKSYAIKNQQPGSATNYIVLSNIENFKIPLPPLEVQEKIVTEIEEYEKIIEGAKEVVDNWKPKIEVSKDWEMVELGEVCEFKRGTSVTKEKVINGDIPVIAGGQKPAYYHNESNRNGENITVSASGAYAGFINYFNIPIFVSDAFSISEKEKNKLNLKFLFYILKEKQNYFYSLQKGAGIPHVHISDLTNLQIPLPSLEVQEKIVAEIEEQQKYIDSCKKLIEIYEEKVKKVINGIVGDGDEK